MQFMLVCWKLGTYECWQLINLISEAFLGIKVSWDNMNNMPDKTQDVNNAVICYKEAVQFSASFVTSLLASF